MSVDAPAFPACCFLGTPGYTGYRKVSTKSSWQAIPENTPPLGALPESGNIARQFKCLVANLSLKEPCVGSSH